MTFEEFQEVKNASWRIEEFHRGVKQCCNIGNLRAFFILEKIRIDKEISWYEIRRELNRISVGNAIISLFEDVRLSLI